MIRRYFLKIKQKPSGNSSQGVLYFMEDIKNEKFKDVLGRP